MEKVNGDFLGNLLLKLIGSVAGTFLALIMRPPRSRKGFQQRAAFSIVAGLLLSPIVVMVLRKFFDVPTDAETVVAVAAVTAFGSWWLARKFLQTVENWKANSDE